MGKSQSQESQQTANHPWTLQYFIFSFPREQHSQTSSFSSDMPFQIKVQFRAKRHPVRDSLTLFAVSHPNPNNQHLHLSPIFFETPLHIFYSLLSRQSKRIVIALYIAWKDIHISYFPKQGFLLRLGSIVITSFSVWSILVLINSTGCSSSTTKPPSKPPKPMQSSLDLQ